MQQHPRNIVIVAHHYPPHLTGVGMVAYNQAKVLVKLGHMVTIITSSTDVDEKSGMNDGIKVVRVKALNFFEKWDVPFPIFSPRLITLLSAVIKHADIVHVHDAFYMSSFFAAIIARFHKKPIVLTQHVAMVAHPSKIVMAIEKITYATTGAVIFKLSDLITTYNNTVEKFLTGKGVPEKKIIQLINGVDTDFFHPLHDKAAAKKELGLSAQQKVVLFVGRFVPKKGFNKVLAAHSDKYQIVLVGGVSQQKNTNEMVFLGKLGPEKLALAYQAADIFVLPSESEGFPLSIQEAMASGLPIITTNDDGYSRYNLNKELVCLIDHPTDASVREAIERLVADEAKLKAMSVYSESYAKEHFNWPHCVDQLVQLYDKVSEKKDIKRIAFVSDTVYPYNKGGKEKRLYDITTRLAREGHEVPVYCMHWWPGKKVVVEDGVRFHAISSYHKLYSKERRSIREAIYFSLASFKLLTKPFDIVDVDHIPHLVLFPMKIVCMLRGKKMVATWHEVWGRTYWNGYLGSFAGYIASIVEKMSVKMPDLIVSVSDHTTRGLHNVLHAKGKVVTITNGLDVHSIHTQAHSASSYDVVFAGRLLAHKNADALLRSIALLKQEKEDISLVIVGDGPEKENLQRLTKELGIENNVTMPGFVNDHGELYRIMHSSKVFVLPSSREGFGITIIEANACGLPVVTVDSEHNAAKELVLEGENGTISALEPRALADGIKDMLKNRKSPEQYMKYSEKYDWSRLIPQIEQVYGIKNTYGEA